MALNTTQQIIKLIYQSKHILITIPTTDNGDALASALALKLFIEKFNRPVDIFAQPKNKTHLSFLPQAEKIKTELNALRKLIITIDIKENKVSEFYYDVEDDKLKIYITPHKNLIIPHDVSVQNSDFKYDLIITLGASDLESLGEIYQSQPDFFYNVTLINIDNSAANEHYGQVNLIELNSSSVAEIIYHLMQTIKTELIDETIATHLLTGIIIKTNSFRQPYIGPQTLLSASQLIKLGADRQFIINSLNKNKKLSALNLWGRVLARLKQDTHYKLAWSLLNQNDFQKSGAQPDDLDGVVNELIADSPQIEITLILYETTRHHIAGILYSSPNFNALELTRPFNPQGTARQASFNLSTHRLAAAEEEVINQLRQRIKS